MKYFSPSFTQWPFRCAVLALGLLLACVASAPADVVILKDGFVIQGTVRKETELFVDKASGQSIPLLKANGFDYIDEGPKLSIFSSHHKQLGEISKDIKIRPDYKAYMTSVVRRSNYPLPAIIGGRGAPPDFDKNWKRMFEVNVAVAGGGFDRIEQQITYLDPYTCYVVSTTHNWAQGFRTSEMDPAKVRTLLYAHPELVEADGKCQPLKRMAITRFFIDAGWLQFAREEVDRLKKDHPAPLPKEAQEQFDLVVRILDYAVGDLVVSQAEQALHAGRYNRAGELLAAFPDKTAEPRDVERYARAKAVHKAAMSRYIEGRFQLRKLIDAATGDTSNRAAIALGGTPVAATLTTFQPSAQLSALAVAAESVYRELHPDSAHRIEFFVQLAETADRERAAGREPSKTAAELLATAVTGWVKGKAGASPVPEAALKAWSAREMVLAAQRAPDRNRRSEVIDQYKKGYPVALDELVQIIALLPPASPENLTARTGTLASEKDGAPPETYRRRTTATDDHPGGVEYLVKLPPEYHHGRSYPVLIALTSPSMNPEVMTLALTNEAEKHGYIVIVPIWTGQFDTKGFQWLAEDHDYVTATLRDAIRHFNVDNDRVFLFGAGDGGNMAFDVGLSHPDLFAGVLLMSPSNARWQGTGMQYWPNAQKLPFYVVTGQLAGKPNTDIRFTFNQWMPKGFPGIHVLYKGRILEWFPGETPTMFDWMSRKKRVNGAATLQLADARRYDWQIMRPGDNHFYWLGAEDIAPGNLMDGKALSNIYPAGMQGDVKGNLIALRARGVRTVNVWLSRDMIDWAKPVRVSMNGQSVYGWKPKVIEQDIEVLLDDYAARGDRRMLFLAKLAFQNRQ